MKIKIEVIGRIGKDAELIKNGESSFVSFPLAITESWKNKAGEKQEKTTWVRIQKSAKADTTLQNYLLKGDMVCIEGKPTTKAYTKKNGDLASEIVINARDLVFLTKAEAKTAANNAPAQSPDDSDDSPF